MPKGKNAAPAAAEKAEAVAAPAAKTEAAPVPAEKKTAKKPAAKKTAAKKPAAKTAAKKPAAKTAAKKTAAKTAETIIQSSGKEYTEADIIAMCKDAYRGGTKKQIKSLSVYIKAENGVIRAYYVVNDKSEGLFIDL